MSCAGLNNEDCYEVATNARVVDGFVSNLCPDCTKAHDRVYRPFEKSTVRPAIKVKRSK